MIRLIASDLDGTLLNSQKQLPSDFFSVLEKLKAKGVRFIAASGRSYATLRRNFAPYAEDLTFISDNGARILDQGKILHEEPIPEKIVQRVLEVCSGLPDVTPIFCSAEESYANVSDPWLHQCILSYFGHYQNTDSLGFLRENIYKISICDRAGAAKNSFRLMPQDLRDQAELQVSAEIWMDVMKKGVNKGRALKDFQKRYGISREETMAFGDFYNDSQMLLQAEYSFVMENANPDMRTFGKYTAPSNDQDGVMRMIKKYVLNETDGN